MHKRASMRKALSLINTLDQRIRVFEISLFGPETLLVLRLRQHRR